MHKLTLSFRDRFLKTYQIMDARTTIGSSPDCNICIDNLAVKPEHVVIELQDDALTLRDISGSGGVQVNGKAVTECELNTGDRITLGKHTISYTRELTSSFFIHEKDMRDENAPPPTPAPAREEETGWLQFMNGPKLGRTLRLDRSLTRLGNTGKQSAMIASRNGGYFISHLEGEVATRVGSSEIGNGSLQLKDGDTIQIGDIKLLFFTGK